MANTKISQLTELTTPTGNEELVYAYNNTNGKIKMDTIKSFAGDGKQDTLVSGTNIKTINDTSLLGSGNITISGGGGSSSYDAVVDAAGNGDYTTIGAAVAAGKYNLYIKNGSYTETSGLNISTGGYLSLIGESRDGVTVTVPEDCDVTDGRFINMGNSPKYLYIYNIKFNITFTSVRDFVRSGNSAFDIRIENCDFIYSSTRTYNSYLFYCTECIKLASGSDSQKVVSEFPWNGLYGCSFYTESSNTNRIIVRYGDSYCYGCKFTTGVSAGEISFIYGDKYFDKCYIDVFQRDGCDACFVDTVIKIKTGGLVEKSNSQSYPNCFEACLFYRSSFYIAGTLGTNPTDGLMFGFVKDSSIAVNDSRAAILLANVAWGNKLRGLYNSYVDCNGSDCSVLYSVSDSRIYNCGDLILGGTSSWAAYERYCNNYFESNKVDIGMSEGACIGNTFDGESSSTITLHGNYSVYMGNIMRNYTVTDSGTGNIKVNNVGQS